MTHTTHNDELRKQLTDAINNAVGNCAILGKIHLYNGGFAHQARVKDAVDAVIGFVTKAREDQDRIARLEEREKTIDENTSDGYHTFRELYTFRKMYNAVLFNEWATQGVHDVHKSKKHSDGELCFGGGWFVVYATTPYGQISNHYELADWDLFKCEEREVATKFDGHTPQDVLSTLKALTTQYNNTV